MNTLQFILLLIFIISVHSNTKKKGLAESSASTKATKAIIDVEGLNLGEQLLHELDYQRSFFGLKQDIQRTDRMHQLAFEYTNILLENPSKLKVHPDFNSRAKRFTDKCVYSEFAVALIQKDNFAHEALKLWIKDQEALVNIKREYDEAGAYCANYGNGYLCVATCLNLPKELETS